jgi:pimeloyl-ACP methyl ester carboxylesterase
MRKTYIDGPQGQVHCRIWGDPGKPLLVCLPPSPYSGLAYTTIAPLLAEVFQVVAMDYPGFGASDAVSGEATIADYAEAALAVAEAFSPDRPASYLGFHTGCLVAVEASLQKSSLVEHLFLIDVPYFDAETRAGLLPKMGTPIELTESMEMLAAAWEFSISKKIEHVSIDRAYKMFVDQISSGRGGNAAFNAAFSYPCEEKFAALDVPTTIIATQSGLLTATRASAEAVPHADFIELLNVTAAALDKGAPEIAAEVLRQFTEKTTGQRRA